MISKIGHSCGLNSKRCSKEVEELQYTSNLSSIFLFSVKFLDTFLFSLCKNMKILFISQFSQQHIIHNIYHLELSFNLKFSGHVSVSFIHKTFSFFFFLITSWNSIIWLYHFSLTLIVFGLFIVIFCQNRQLL